MADADKIQPRKRVDDTEMDITPMIDITFLLLIFFLVASKMDESTAVDLPPARTGMAVAARNSVIITVDKGDEEGGPAAVFKGDGAIAANRFSSPDLEQMETDIAQYVADRILEDPRLRNVLIKAAKGLKQREVARVQRAISQAEGAEQLYVAVMEAD